MTKKERKIVLTESQLGDVVDYAFMTYGSKKKVPKNLFETKLFDEYKFLNEAEEDDDDDEPIEDESKKDKVTDEQLRIDSLKIAVKLSRLMNKVTAEDLLEISTKVSSYLKSHQVGTEYVPEDDGTTPLENKDEKNSEDNLENSDVPGEDIDANNEFTLDDVSLDGDEDVENDSDEDESEEANEAGSDIPQEFIL